MVDQHNSAVKTATKSKIVDKEDSLMQIFELVQRNEKERSRILYFVCKGVTRGRRGSRESESRASVADNFTTAEGSKKSNSINLKFQDE